MNRKAILWDLDGTLLDSYTIMVSSLQKVLLERSISVRKEAIRRYVMEYSVHSFLEKVAGEINQPWEQMKERFSEINDARNGEIQLMRHAREALENLSHLGVSHYVYTHKGKSTDRVLENTGIQHYFTEIVTSQNGFPRKPSPEAIAYLMDRHHLQRDHTFYVGDRSIDVDCAKNAGVKSILFLASAFGKATGKEDYVVRDLLEIEEIIRFPG